MNNQNEKNLALSLTAEDVKLIPYLPYLLQDLWDLGTPSSEVAYLLEKNISNFKDFKVLDLACGKGAVSIPLAKQLQIPITMVDIFPEFIQTAKEKAIEYNVSDLCTFRVEDVLNTLNVEKGKNWDCVLFCSAGNILGNQKETIAKLKTLISPEGYIILADAYLLDSNSEDIRFKSCDFITYDEWLKIFDDEGIELIDSVDDDKKEETDETKLIIELISNRVTELSKKHPELKELFESYLQSQINEFYDIDNNLICPIWLLKRK